MTAGDRDTQPGTEKGQASSRCCSSPSPLQGLKPALDGEQISAERGRPQEPRARRSLHQDGERNVPLTRLGSKLIAN